MRRQVYFLGVQLFAALALIAPQAAHAEDIFIDCNDANAENEQCAALYAEQAFLLPTAESQQAPNSPNYQVMAPDDPNYQAVLPNNISSENPDIPIIADPGQDFAVPGMGYEVPQQQVIFRDTAAPLSISQPLDDADTLGSEYAVYKTPDGSLIVEREVTQESEDGITVRTSRTKETTVTPPYVEMPSISAHQRSGNMAYGQDTHDWEANNGDSLRALLISWGQKAGWTVVWKLDRDYILEAGVVFRGNFTEVASAIIRTFARAIPAPIGTFYKGNRVLVISTQEDDNA